MDTTSPGIGHNNFLPVSAAVVTGISRAEAASGAENATFAATLTQQGTIVGTPRYMSPEQLEGREADQRSDIFAFGLTFYEMLTGRRAFDGDNAASVISAIMTAEPPALPQQELAADVHREGSG